MESDLNIPSPGSSDIQQEVQQEQVDITTTPEDTLNQSIDVQNVDVTQPTDVSAIEEVEVPVASETPRYNPYGTPQNLSVREKDTAIERAFGKNFLTDFFGDIYRAGSAGRAQGATLNESLELFAKGDNVTDQDIEEFIAAQQSLQNRGESDEMKDFNRIYQGEGGSLWGFIKGVAANPSVISQVFVSSTTQMLNASTLGAAAAGGVAGSFVPVIGTIGGAMGAAGATLETGMTFSELLQKELADRELDFSTENVRTILEDEEALSSIRYKAAGRGLAIGIVEGATARLASSVGAKVVSRGPRTLGRNLKALGAGGLVEMAGGSTGEVAGRIVAGQEMDVAEIGFEGFAGTATAPISVGYGIYKAPKYYVNKKNGGEEMAATTAESMEDIVENSPDEDFAKMEIEIVNNPELKEKAEKRKSDIHEKAVIEGQLRRAGVEDQNKIDEILPLQKELNALAEDTGEASKLKRSEIKKQIADILNREDAIQEQSTDEVVSEVQATNIQEVESGGDTSVESTREDQQTTETTEETKTEETEVVQEDKVTEMSPAPDENRPTTKRERQPERRKVPGSSKFDIEIDAQGKATVVERKTGRPIKKDPPKKVQEYLLKEGIDVNEGRKSEEVFKEKNPDINESEALEKADEIILESENVREVAEAIDVEENKSTDIDPIEELNPEEGNTRIRNVKITEREWYERTGEKGKDIPANIRKNYISVSIRQEEAFNKKSKANKLTTEQLKKGLPGKGTPLDILGQQVQDNGGLEASEAIDEFVEFAKANPDGKAIDTSQKDKIKALKTLFTELTGLKATKQNLAAVLSVDPNRPPLEVVQEDLKARDIATSKEPKVNKRKKVSAKKVVEGTKKKKEVTVDEAEALKDQIKLESKAAREADAAAKKKDKEKITPRKRNKARKNIKSKIGAAKTLGVMLGRMLAVNPKIVPDSVIKQYQNIVNMLSERKGVLTLPEIKKLTADVESVNKVLDEEYSIAGSLAERYEYFKRTDFKINDKTPFEAVIKEMLDQELITQEEAKLMEKYENRIDPKEKVEKTEEEIAAEKQVVIEEISKENKKVKVPNDLSRDQKKLADRFRKLLTDTDILERMEVYQLKNMRDLLDNINNGYVPHLVEMLTERMTAIERSKSLEQSVIKSKPLRFSMMYAKFKDLFTKKGAVLELIRRNPLVYIDQVFGDFNTKSIYRSIFEPTAKAQSQYASATKEIRNKINDARNKVFKSFGNDPNATTISAYKQQLYLLQREYEANPDNKYVNPAIDVLKATIAAIDEQKTSLTPDDAAVLQKILDDFSTTDGNSIDNTKLFDSFNAAEKNSINVMDEINQGNEAAAIFTASTIRGNSFNPLNNYVHHNVLFTQEADSDATQPDFVSKYKSGLKPSTKGQSLILRTGDVMPLNFNVYSSTQKGAEYVMLDYHMTAPIRTARKTITELKKRLEENGRIPSEQREMLNTIEKSYEEVNTNVLTSDFGETTIADRAADFMSRQGYRTVLAGTGRFAAELLSNIGMAIFVDSRAFQDGMAYSDMIFSDAGASVMNNVGSSQKDRVYAEGLAGRFVDPNVINRADNSAGSNINGEIENKIKKIYSFVDQKWIGTVEQIADFLISTPDKVVMRPMWFGTFGKEFKKVSGQDVDFKKIADNDEAYIKENKEAIDAATAKADETTTFIGAADNPYMGILKGTSKPNDSVMKKGFNNFNNFMTRFLIFEFVTARTALNAITTDNSRMTTEEGAKILAGVTTRMMTYSLLSTMLGAGLLGLFFEDDEEDKDLDKQFGQALGQTFTSLLIGRDFGNAMKAILNIGIEKFNESHLEFLRDGEYDPYKDSLQYSVLPKKQQGESASLGDLLLRFGGSFGPALSTADLVVRKMSEPTRKTPEARERQLDEKLIRMPLEIAGNLGLLPIYKDVRKVAIREIYKDLRRAKKMKGKTRSKDEMNKLKTSNPRLYQQIISRNPDAAPKTKKQKAYDAYVKNPRLWKQKNPGKPIPKRPR